MLLSKYRLSINYIKGEKNIGADAFSRIKIETSHDDTALANEVYATSDDPSCVMDGSVLLEYQDVDPMIQKIKSACLSGTNNPDYQLKTLLGCTLVAYQKRVIVPENLCADLIQCYHANLGHPASGRQHKTMRQVLYWPSMESTILTFVKSCLTCKRAKVHGGKQDYGLLPPRTLKTVNPFDVVHVDLIDLTMEVMELSLLTKQRDGLGEHST